ncbi:hypothetical protein [Xanthomonas sp. BRIP62411]|uniref:hypothetical protein n=1 Tax=Xanthomonas sp. BRIP62411 TaxID=2182389 RepID=UPI0013DFA000|nr:hypothetical protein [Xanthomonas sp. BRIP62411]
MKGLHSGYLIEAEKLKSTFYPSHIERRFQIQSRNQIATLPSDAYIAAGSPSDFELRPAQLLLVAVEDRGIGRLPSVGLLLLVDQKLIQAFDKQHVGHLFKDLYGVGNAAAPESVPDAIDLGHDCLGDHAVHCWLSAPSGAEPLSVLRMQVRIGFAGKLAVDELLDIVVDFPGRVTLDLPAVGIHRLKEPGHQMRRIGV